MALVGPAAAQPHHRALTTRGATTAVDGAAFAPCAGRAMPAAAGVAGDGSWFRLDPVLDRAGMLTGQRLVSGRLGDRRSFAMPLAAEAFASLLTAGRVVVGDNDGRRSTVRLLDLARRCAAPAYAGTTLVRRAVFDPWRAAIVEFRLDRGTRADLGVWSRPLDGSRSSRLLDPLRPSARVGLVFSTDLTWSADGQRLVVSSCGEVACLTRLLDRRSGAVTLVDDDRVGETLGLVGDDLVAYGGCRSLPCRIVALHLGTGRIRTIAEAAGLAGIGRAGGRPVVAYEDYRSPAGTVRVVGLDGRFVSAFVMADGDRIMPGTLRAGAAIAAPEDVAVVAPAGRPGAGPAAAGLVSLADGRRLPAAEVVR